MDIQIRKRTILGAILIIFVVASIGLTAEYVNEKDFLISSLSSQIREKDSQINTLNSTVSAQDSQINSMNYTIRTKDNLIYMQSFGTAYCINLAVSDSWSDAGYSNLLLGTGTQWVRVDVDNGGASGSSYQRMAKMKNLGIKLLVIFDYWFMPPSDSSWQPITTISQWTDIVRKGLQTFGKIADAIECWNEPDLGQFEVGYMDGTPQHYVDMLKVLHDEMQNADVTVPLVAGAVSQIGNSSQTPNTDNYGGYFLQQIRALGSDSYCDVYSVHAYLYSQNIVGCNGNASLYWQKAKAITGSKPLWITEFGDEQIQTTWMQTWFSELKSVGCPFVCWFLFEDNSNYAMVDSSFNTRPSYNIFRSFATTRENSVIYPGAPVSYVIGVSGNLYRMKNETTSQIDYQSTDASSVINNALGNGTHVTLGEGTFNLTSTLMPLSNSILDGQGDGTILFMTNTNAIPAVLVNNSNNVKISNLKVDHGCPFIAGGWTKTVNEYDLQVLNCTNVEVAGCHFTEAGDYCVAFGCVPDPTVTWQGPCQDINFHNNLIDHTASDGFHIRGGIGNIVTNNVINQTGDDMLAIAGLPWDTLNGITITNNVLINGQLNGFKVTTELGVNNPAPIANQVTGVTVANNYFANIGISGGGGTGGMWLQIVSANYTVGTVVFSNFTITGNQIINTTGSAFMGDALATGCTLKGIMFSDNNIQNCGNLGLSYNYGTYFRCFQESIISNNRFTNDGNATGHAAIELWNCSNMLVTGNSISQEACDGIHEENGVRNTFSNNQITSVGHHGIYGVSSDKDLITGNYIDNFGLTSTGDGISWTGQNTTITNNKIVDYTTYGRYEIYCHSGSDGIEVTDNDVRYTNINTVNMIKNSATNSIIKQNLGFVTENSGTQANCVNGTLITHGLAGTPNGYLTVTMEGTAWGIGTTNYIQISVVNKTSSTFQLVMVWSNGTAVDATHSSQTVDWSTIFIP